MERFRALLKVEGLEGADGEHFNDRVLVDECGGFVQWFWVWVSVWRDFQLGFVGMPMPLEQGIFFILYLLYALFFLGEKQRKGRKSLGLKER